MANLKIPSPLRFTVVGRWAMLTFAFTMCGLKVEAQITSVGTGVQDVTASI